MPTFFVAFIMLTGITAHADDLGDLKAAVVRYVATVKAALAISDGSDCSERIAQANDYAAAKIAYYRCGMERSILHFTAPSIWTSRGLRVVSEKEMTRL